MANILSPAVFEPVAPPPPSERTLAGAFANFTAAAASLEHSYFQLQGEVARLRAELENTNRDLARSHEKNQQMRQHLKRILEGLPCGVLVSETDRMISLVNPESRRLLGVAEDSPLSCVEDIASPIRELLTASVAGKERQTLLGSGDIARWISVRHALLPAAEGGSSIFILRDITESKQQEQEREAWGRREALTEMSALLAHEVRNPLGSLDLFAGLLAGSELEGEQQQWAGHLQAGLRTLGATVNNVLQFHSQPAPGLAATDLGDLLDAFEDFLRPLARQAGVTVHLRNSLGCVRINGDRDRLQQVLLNLALNAFRAMPRGGILTIRGYCKIEGARSAAASRGPVVEISDMGGGIRRDDRERIWTPGFTTSAGSPGLGLAVCQKIMEQHGGSIAVVHSLQEYGGEQVESSGTTFRLQFPARQDVA